jgi:hypothetical protein
MTEQKKPNNKDRKVAEREHFNRIGDVVDLWKLIREKGMKLADEKSVDTSKKS